SIDGGGRIVECSLSKEQQRKQKFKKKRGGGKGEDNVLKESDDRYIQVMYAHTSKHGVCHRCNSSNWQSFLPSAKSLEETLLPPDSDGGAHLDNAASSSQLT